MDRLLPTAWAKLTRDADGNVTAWLGLVEHSIDVAAVSRALLELPSTQRSLGRFAGRPLTELDVERLTVLALLHDLGKASVGFQTKCLSEAAREAVFRGSGIRRQHCGHTRVVGGLLLGATSGALLQAAPFAEIDTWEAIGLWLAAVSHHGEPITLGSFSGATGDEQHPSNWKPFGAYDPWHAIRELGRVARLLFPSALATEGSPLPQHPAFAHAFAGLVSLADWIGSSTGEGFFPYGLGQGSERWFLALERAREALVAMRVDPRPLQEDLRRRSLSFGDAFRDPSTRAAYHPTDVQAAMAAKDLGSTVVVEAETGSGKTEAALWRFKCLFERGEVDSLAFVLPTRVSAVQIEGRVHRFIQALFPDLALRPNVLLAVPGYMRVDGIDAIERLPGWEVLLPDTERELSAHQRWVAENTKRYLAACCAVGTIDQVLLAGLQARHSHLRGFALLRSLLVVDEVHASDVYMESILQVVLRRHRAAGGHAVLLSATLATDARRRLLVDTNIGRTPPPNIAAPYPALTDQANTRPLQSGGRSKHVRIDLRACMGEAPDVASIACRAIEDGARVLVIRNTVDAALDVQAELEQRLGMEHPALFRAAGVVCPHHGRFAPEDRRILDAAIEARFGKHAPADPCVLVGTQTLEQSLDIDADLLITDLAPIDVLLQRIGRLHRHSRSNRPSPFKEAQAVILVPGERDLLQWLRGQRRRHGFGKERAYPNVLAVDATWELLERHPTLSIPAQNRELVEHATHHELLQARAERLGGEWADQWRQLEGIARAQAQAATVCDWNTEWERSAFPDKEEQIRTRLGADALIVPLPEAWTSPFGAQLNQIPIPAWMTGHTPPTASDAELHGKAVAITLGDHRYLYDRHGLLIS